MFSTFAARRERGMTHLSRAPGGAVPSRCRWRRCRDPFRAAAQHLPLLRRRARPRSVGNTGSEKHRRLRSRRLWPASRGARRQNSLDEVGLLGHVGEYSPRIRAHRHGQVSQRKFWTASSERGGTRRCAPNGRERRACPAGERRRRAGARRRGLRRSFPGIAPPGGHIACDGAGSDGTPQLRDPFLLRRPRFCPCVCSPGDTAYRLHAHASASA
jgi:hypothetical protein